MTVIQPIAAPTFRCRPDRVRGIPILLEILLFALDTPKNRRQEKPPRFIATPFSFQAFGIAFALLLGTHEPRLNRHTERRMQFDFGMFFPVQRESWFSRLKNQAASCAATSRPSRTWKQPLT